MGTPGYGRNRPRIGRATAVHRRKPSRDVNDKSPMIYDGEKVEKKKVRNVGDVNKVGRIPLDSRQCPVDRRRLVAEALPTSEKLKNSADCSGDFNLKINLAYASPIIKVPIAAN